MVAPRVSIPLSLIFTVQCALVIGAFVAVILVLTEQQRTEFQDALYTRLRMQQSKALQQVYAPLGASSQLFRAYGNHYTRRPVNSTFATRIPSQTSTFTDAKFFFDHFAPLLAELPLLDMIVLTNRSDVPVPYDPTRLYFAFFLANRLGISIGRNGTIEGCPVLPSFAVELPEATVPLCPFGSGPYDTISFGTNDMFRDFPDGRDLWGFPVMVHDPTATPAVGFRLFYIIQLSRRHPNGPDKVLYFSMNIPHLGPIVSNARASSASHAALFSFYSYSIRGTYLISATAYTPDINAFPAGGSQVSTRGGETNIATLDNAFYAAQARCYTSADFARNTSHNLNITMPGDPDYQSYTQQVANPCAEPQVFEAHGFVIAVARLVTDDYLDQMLLQYTPRAHFFGASDLARLQGAMIGVGAALMVVVSSVLILAAVWVPVRALQRGMDLAAEMRNDEVPVLWPVLTELSRLAVAFAEMNERLLLARPFLPQSLLMRNRMSTTEASEVSVVEEEGSVEMQSSMSSGPQGVQSSSRRGSERSERGGHSASPAAHTSHSSHAAPSTHSSQNKGRIAHAVLSTVMNARRVGILVVNVRGFHAGTHAMIGAQVVDVHRRLAECVEQCVGRERGIVDAFHGDRFVAAFNTARPCGVPAKLGALAALGLDHAFSGDAPLREAFPLGLSMGLSCGRALVGNMGTATMQRLSTVGAAYSEAVGLQEVMARGVLRRGAVPVAGRCLFSGKALPELEGHVRYQVVGGVGAGRLAASSAGVSEGGAKRLVTFAAAENHAFAAHLLDTPALTTTSTAEPHNPGPTEPIVVVAVLHQAVSSDGPGDEWLYSLQAAEAGDTFRTLNTMLCALLLRGSLVNLEVLRVMASRGNAEQANPPLDNDGIAPRVEDPRAHPHEVSLAMVSESIFDLVQGEGPQVMAPEDRQPPAQTSLFIF